MRVFQYEEPNDPKNGDFSSVTRKFSEKEIEETYYPWWKKTGLGLGFEEYELTMERCLEDWCITNWATEVKDKEND